MAPKCNSHDEGEEGQAQVDEGKITVAATAAHRAQPQPDEEGDDAGEHGRCQRGRVHGGPQTSDARRS